MNGSGLAVGLSSSSAHVHALASELQRRKQFGVHPWTMDVRVLDLVLKASNPDGFDDCANATAAHSTIESAPAGLGPPSSSGSMPVRSARSSRVTSSSVLALAIAALIARI